MDAATALTAAQTLFVTLQCAEVRKLCSIYNYESELRKLLKTIEMIKKCLLDADSKCQELTNEGQYWVQNLKDVVYDADDLLDEFNTIAHELKGMDGGKIFKKVRRFFSTNNQLIFAFDKSKEIKKLREKLDDLAKNHTDFGFGDLYKPVNVRKETSPYVLAESIIGRDADKETIVDLLLKDDSEKNISFVTIVGIGGLGKTALAQLVFKDHRIKEAFQENMYWVCVSENFDRDWILGKIHKEKNKEECTLQEIHRNVQKLIEGKRYLLVLDDVWCEERKNWVELKDFLNLGGRGSRILVTSRSKKAAEVIGKCEIHELEGLSKKESWELFKNISLEKREDEAVTDDLVEIGEDILEKCANVPLSIKVVASLLFKQDIAVWKSFRSIDLAYDCEKGIMPTLMFSYYHLSPELKTCFSFCSLFPEDYEIDKLELIHLWMAQGYLVPSSNNESMEDVGEKYLSILLHRCFFQNITRDKIGEVCSFKMHDLMRDLARNVAAKEFLTLTACTKDLEGKVRHLYIESNKVLTTWFRSRNCPTKTLRTCMKYSVSKISDVDAIISNCSRLRVLDIWDSVCIRNLPDTVGKLSHMRYLDLSNFYDLEMLPKSIIKLHNLQTLRLRSCRKLKKLPDDTSKLVNLRMLDMHGCRSLTHMPEDIGKLVNLRVLIISECESLTHMPEGMGELLQLRYLVLPSDYKFEMLSKSIVKLRNLQMLDCDFSILKELPEDTCRLVNLRMLDLSKCRILTHLPQGMGEMLHLRCLDLSHNDKLEMLPKSITKLYNLQTLKLGYCSSLKELPEDTCKLVNLRVLDIRGCNSFTHMPAGMGKLTCLHMLPTFLLSKDDDNKGKLRDLAALISNLSGDLDVKDYKHEGYLISSTVLHVKLQSLKLSCKLTSSHPFEETLMESLFCNHQFQHLEMEYYGGTKLPSFALGLVRIDLRKCDRLQHLPSSLSQLCHLKKLCLRYMQNLEYIDSNAPSSSTNFFPALEKLELEYLPALKGWWRDIRWTEKEAVFIPSFPRLWKLNITGCERLTDIPPCPLLTHLQLDDVNEALTFCKKEGAVQSNPISLKYLSIDNACVFNSLSREFVGSDVYIYLRRINMGTIRDGLQSCSSSLQKLALRGCRGLENLEIEHLTNLKSLELLLLNIKGMPWEFLQCLSFLEIYCCNEMTILPKGIQYLTSLQSLFIKYCDNLEDLGECFNSLASLKQLKIQWCTKLKSLPEEMRRLTSLTALEIGNCARLKSLPEAMRHLTSLTTLKVYSCDELESLPEAMRHLTSLTTLQIAYCNELKSLPEAMIHLTSLTTLKITYNHGELAKRCRKLDGEDWPKICHIPNVNIR